MAAIVANDEKGWFYSRFIWFSRTSYIFAGLGSLVIDGDALICQAPRIIDNSYLTPTQTALTQAQSVQLFLQQLRSTGFDRIKIVFFHSHSRWTEKLSVTSFGITSEASKLLGCGEEDVAVFESWSENQDWLDFVVNEHTSLVLTTEEDVYQEADTQFKFIYDVCQVSKVQASLLDGAVLDSSSFQSFLINPVNRILDSVNYPELEEVPEEEDYAHEMEVRSRIWSFGSLVFQFHVHCFSCIFCFGLEASWNACDQEPEIENTSGCHRRFYARWSSKEHLYLQPLHLGYGFVRKD